MKFTYIFLVGVPCNVAGILRIFDEIRPPRSELWILDLAVLQLEFEVGVKSDELRINPSKEGISQARREFDELAYWFEPDALSQSSGRLRSG